MDEVPRPIKVEVFRAPGVNGCVVDVFFKRLCPQVQVTHWAILGGGVLEVAFILGGAQPLPLVVVPANQFGSFARLWVVYHEVSGIEVASAHLCQGLDPVESLRCIPLKLMIRAGWRMVSNPVASTWPFVVVFLPRVLIFRRIKWCVSISKSTRRVSTIRNGHSVSMRTLFKSSGHSGVHSSGDTIMGFDASVDWLSMTYSGAAMSDSNTRLFRSSSSLQASQSP
ncbi:hypothetical protein RRG08_062848 [Elysia crispata]|uniref:Uncharacterized protein n=1 Tax=Elysia crispata TaxID=231223 RepID=A0AAE0Z9M0_9GAST|nr:hypothetical protein RRG08_062848 [Elysia crispata]